MGKTELMELLREKGLRATNNRVQVLAFFHAKKHPIGVDVIAKKFLSINLTTLYRMMADFCECGILLSYDLGHGHVDYELADRPHHHHAVCDQCGKVEEIYSCKSGCVLKKTVMKATDQFAEIYAPTATMFGRCKTCEAT